MSTVLANTITAVGGGGSTVKVNNDSTYISEGGAVTDHNLLQGVAKHWIGNLDMSDGSLVDSFNTSSVADVDAGDFNVNLTNAYSVANSYSLTFGGTNSSNGNAFISMQGQTPTTSQYRMAGFLSNDTNLDMDMCKSATHGDLA
tara:strand:- start:250 stop:681 length:432 start_codon:yes stop_codon:yes gene_type:complete